MYSGDVVHIFLEDSIPRTTNVLRNKVKGLSNIIHLALQSPRRSVGTRLPHFDVWNNWFPIVHVVRPYTAECRLQNIFPEHFHGLLLRIQLPTREDSVDFINPLFTYSLSRRMRKSCENWETFMWQSDWNKSSTLPLIPDISVPHGTLGRTSLDGWNDALPSHKDTPLLSFSFSGRFLSFLMTSTVALSATSLSEDTKNVWLFLWLPLLLPALLEGFFWVSNWVGVGLVLYFQGYSLYEPPAQTPMPHSPEKHHRFDKNLIMWKRKG